MNPRQRFEELLSSYAEQELTPAQRDEFEALTASDPLWRVEAEQERQIVALLRAGRHAKAPANLLRSAIERAKVVDIAPAPAVRRRDPGLWRYTAAAALLLAGVVAYIAYQGHEFQSRIDVTTLQRANTPSQSKPDMTASDAAGGSVKVAKTDALPTAKAKRESPMEGAVNASEPDNRKKEAALGVPLQQSIDEKGRISNESTESEVFFDKVAPPPPASAPAPALAREEPKRDRDLELNFTRDAELFAVLPGKEQAATPPTRAELDQVLLAKSGRILLDTPWYETAAGYAVNRAELPAIGAADNTRYVVVEFAGAKNGRELKDSAALRESDSPAMFRQLHDEQAPTRQVFAYSATSVPAGTRARGAGAAAAKAATSDPAGQSAMESRLQEESAPAKLATSPTTGALDDSTLNSRNFETFDEFFDTVKQTGAQFLYYTADRPLAFAEDTGGQAAARTPAPAEPFTGYIVFVYTDTDRAAQMPALLSTWTGHGVRNVRTSLTELVTMPDGKVRLILPYRMD